MNSKTLEIYQYWFFKYRDALKQGKIEGWIKKAQHKYSISTQKVIAGSMNHYANKKMDVIGSKTNTRELNVIDYQEYNDIYESIMFDDYRKSNNVRLLIRLLWETGARISEALNLKWEDVNSSSIRINGKGNKERIIPIKNDLFIEKQKTGYVFGGDKKKSYSWAYKTISELGKKNNIENLSPHTFRHSFASRLVSKNIGIEFLSKIMVHSSINTTMIYIHFNEKNINEFLSKI